VEKILDEGLEVYKNRVTNVVAPGSFPNAIGNVDPEAPDFSELGETA
jgi:hypothetical protein